MVRMGAVQIMKIIEVTGGASGNLVPDASSAGKPGLTPIINTGVPSTLPASGPSANLSSQIQTSNYTALGNPGNNTNPTQNSAEQAIVKNQNVSQQLTKGSKLNVPVGPTKKPMQMNVQNVDPNKNVTLTDPKNPTKPGLTYKAADLIKILGGDQ